MIGEINPNSSLLHKYILTATDYFTRWIEAIPLKTVNENQVIYYLESCIITRFGDLDSLDFDNAKYFSSLTLTKYALLNETLKLNIQQTTTHKGMDWMSQPIKT
jgi:hypothetical protein